MLYTISKSNLDLFTQAGKQTDLVARQKKGATRVLKSGEAAEGKAINQIRVTFPMKYMLLYLRVE